MVFCDYMHARELHYTHNNVHVLLTKYARDSSSYNTMPLLKVVWSRRIPSYFTRRDRSKQVNRDNEECLAILKMIMTPFAYTESSGSNGSKILIDEYRSPLTLSNFLYGMYAFELVLSVISRT